MLNEEENNPIMGAGLSTLLPVQNTMAPICGTSPELHQCINPDPTSDLTYHPKTTPYTNPITLTFEQSE